MLTTGWIRWAGIGVAVLVIAGMGLATYSWAYNRGVAAQTIYTAQAKRDTALAVDANKSALATIVTLSGKNAACVASVAAHADAANAAVTDLEAERAKRKTAEGAARRARSKVYSTNKDAAAWAASKVPPSVADTLRN